MRTSTTLVMLAAALLCSCSSPPREEPDDVLVVIPAMDMSADTSRLDMFEVLVPDLPRDMRDVVVDIAPEMHADASDDAQSDLTHDMGEDLADSGKEEDMEEVVISFDALGTKSVRDLFSWAQPGQSNASAPLEMYYSAELDVYVGLDPATGWGLPQVRATFEALHTLRDTLPEAYLPLFERSRTGDTTSLPSPQQAPWTNLNAAAAFVLLSNTFQSAGAVMASNFYALGPNNQSTYTNMPFLNIRPEVIEGRFATAGPQLVYPDLSDAQARDMYLQEGLADSLLHERIHAYISQYYAHDARYGALRSQALGCEYNLEELLVKRTLDLIYEDHQDLFSETHRNYWRRDRELLEASISSSSCYRTYEAQGWLDESLFVLN